MYYAPLIKFTLQVGEGLEVACIDKTYTHADGELDVTRQVSSWDETELSMQRDGLSAVMTEVLSPVIFDDVRKYYDDFSAHVLLKRMFEKYGLYSRAKLRIYKRDDVQLDVYTLLHELDLDFQHYKWNENRITIDGTSPALQQYLKSQGKVKFDIPVEEIKESKQFLYSNLEIESTASYEIPVKPDIDFPLINEQNTYTSLSITHIETDTIEGKSIALSKNQYIETKQRADFGKSQFFVEAQEDMTITLDTKFEIKSYILPLTSGIPEEMILVVLKNGGKVYEEHLTNDGFSIFNKAINWNVSFNLLKGDVLTLALETNRGFLLSPGNYTQNIQISNFDYFKVNWNQTSKTQIFIDVIKPQTLLQKILDKMNPGAFKGTIKGIDENDMLCAAESIRGFENANIHVSLFDMIDWLETKGSIYRINGKELTFDKLENFFKKDKTTLALTKSNTSRDIQIEATGDYSYTSVKIGYKKVDYENTNGRYEPNGTFENTTGYVNDEDKQLSLISPFRADNYGIEFLTWERWKDSKDDKSDNDIFELDCTIAGNNYVFYKDIIFSILGTSIVCYNARLSPRYLAVANENRIGIISSILKFKSTTNNRDAVLYFTEDELFGDIEIKNKLFSPFLYRITVAPVDLPMNDLDGLVTFPCIDERGDFNTKKGFIKEAYKSVPKEKEREWVLFAVED